MDETPLWRKEGMTVAEMVEQLRDFIACVYIAPEKFPGESQETLYYATRLSLTTAFRMAEDILLAAVAEGGEHVTRN